MGQLDATLQKGSKFQGLSGGKDYFKLTPGERRSEGFNFVLDRSVYEEMGAMTKGDHTIYLKNVADTGAAGGVHMPARPATGAESIARKGGGEAQDDEQGSTKDSTFSNGSGGGSGKRKNMQQQTFEVIPDVMDKHGTLMATTMDSANKGQCSMMLWQCEILETEVDVQRRHYEQDEVQHPPRDSKSHPLRHRRPIDNGMRRRVVMFTLSCMQVGPQSSPRVGLQRRAGSRSSSQPGLRLHAEARSLPRGGQGHRAGGGGGGVREDGDRQRDGGRADNKNEQEDDEPLVNRLRRGGVLKELFEWATLWVDDKSFWTKGEGRRLYNIIDETNEYFDAITSGLAVPVVPRNVIMQKTRISTIRITNHAQLQQALSLATKL
ncbi:hypothetical protein CBR_g48732 [Chara braunii]|uniref:Uncharacterized protein n=1 Tax=Chara braunii TaxID=69332 RepID=A0A388K4V9_CHABU|nr:hypothetical protein CBR_g48732 [Chara braunii]|eukprot:GBG64983.1 hypothetical protein CBR_g48732 [Chara braunii]